MLFVKKRVILINGIIDKHQSTVLEISTICNEQILFQDRHNSDTLKPQQTAFDK